MITSLNKINTVSKAVKVLILLIMFIQVSGYFLMIFMGESHNGAYQAKIDLGFFYTFFNVEYNGAWKNLAIALEQNELNSLFILGAAELIPYIFIYYFLIRLFSLYQNALFFTEQNIQYIKNIGFTLICWMLLNLIYPLLVSTVLKLSGISNNINFYFSFGSYELTYLVSGLIIYVIAWIMNEAIKLKQEQALVI